MLVIQDRLTKEKQKFINMYTHVQMGNIPEKLMVLREIALDYKIKYHLNRFGGLEFACNSGEASSIPWSGRSPGEENGNPLQYSCLGDSMN